MTELDGNTDRKESGRMNERRRGGDGVVVNSSSTRSQDSSSESELKSEPEDELIPRVCGSPASSSSADDTLTLI